MYTCGMTTRTRLTTDQKMAALAMIARGDTLSQVAGHLLTEYEVQITESALSKIKKAHMDTIIKMQETISDGQVADAEAILGRSRRLLNRRLDKAERDERALEELDQKYRDGEISSVEEYRRRKAGLLKISIAELTNISKTMHSQTIKLPPAPQLPSGDGVPALPLGHVSTPAHLEALLKAIKDGNTVEITRLTFNPGAQHREPAQPIPA